MDSISPVPADYSSHLITLAQESGYTTFVLSHSDQRIKMEKFPESGTDSAVRATFRVILKDTVNENLYVAKDALGKLVMLEPFDFPGMLMLHRGDGEDLEVSDISSYDGKQSCGFHLVAGLDGKDGTVSLQSEKQQGCYIYSGVDYGSGASVKLNCSSDFSDAGFKQATSFMLKDGISKYHPISFVAKGAKRNFLLAPLLSLRDESYTVYFNT